MLQIIVCITQHQQLMGDARYTCTVTALFGLFISVTAAISAPRPRTNNWCQLVTMINYI